MSREEIREAIIRVSADWVSLDYIASKIDRTTAYLLSDIIPNMLEDGVIVCIPIAQGILIRNIKESDNEDHFLFNR